SRYSISTNVGTLPLGPRFLERDEAITAFPQPPQAVEVLYHKGELPVCEVQRRILVESSSTTYVVDKLCDRGLVRRRPSTADRRVTLLALTPAGRRLIARIFPPHAAAMRRAVAALPAGAQRSEERRV